MGMTRSCKFKSRSKRRLQVLRRSRLRQHKSSGKRFSDVNHCAEELPAILDSPHLRGLAVNSADVLQPVPPPDDACPIRKTDGAMLDVLNDTCATGPSNGWTKIMHVRAEELASSLVDTQQRAISDPYMDVDVSNDSTSLPSEHEAETLKPTDERTVSRLESFLGPGFEHAKPGEIVEKLKAQGLSPADVLARLRHAGHFLASSPQCTPQMCSGGEQAPPKKSLGQAGLLPGHVLPRAILPQKSIEQSAARSGAGKATPRSLLVTKAAAFKPELGQNKPKAITSTAHVNYWSWAEQRSPNVPHLVSPPPKSVSYVPHVVAPPPKSVSYVPAGYRSPLPFVQTPPFWNQRYPGHQFYPNGHWYRVPSHHQQVAYASDLQRTKTPFAPPPPPPPSPAGRNQAPYYFSAVSTGRVDEQGWTRETYILDGLNILKHRNSLSIAGDGALNWSQLKAACIYYKSRGHHVHVFLPKLSSSQDTRLLEVEKELGPDCLVKTPSGCSDDVFMIQYAQDVHGSRIVTNDLFRNHRVNESWVKDRTIKFAFAGGRFIPSSGAT